MVTAQITARFDNAYPDTVIPVVERMTVPVPDKIDDDWWDQYFWPLTGTGRTSADSCLYSVEITQSTTPSLLGLTHEF